MKKTRMVTESIRYQPRLKVDNILWFTGRGDVIVEREAMTHDPQTVFDALHFAFSYMSHPAVMDSWCGGENLLNTRPEWNQQELLRALEEVAVAEATKQAKRSFSKVRRRSFQADRSALVLAMIDKGVAYRCAHSGCDARENLTVDHIVPLSRGGTDELHNLQFMCRGHNAMKGDRT
jgi:5-methylcytosine-specific restriction endonuclease McrA